MVIMIFSRQVNSDIMRTTAPRIYPGCFCLQFLPTFDLLGRRCPIHLQSPLACQLCCFIIAPYDAKHSVRYLYARVPHTSLTHVSREILVSVCSGCESYTLQCYLTCCSLIHRHKETACDSLLRMIDYAAGLRQCSFIIEISTLKMSN